MSKKAKNTSKPGKTIKDIKKPTQTPHHSRRIGQFRSSKEDMQLVQQVPETPQTTSKAYSLAFDDREFMTREELRPVRLQLELLKPEMLMQEAGIESTVVLFGGARIPAPGEKPSGKTKKQNENLSKYAKFYQVAHDFAVLCSNESAKTDHSEFVVCSGGGPGVMEAANKGASEVGAPSIGLNIVLPHEQAPNIYVTPELSFQFHYFAIRKMHFLMRAKAITAFPGGFGTMDELFETLTLIQTKRVAPMPVILFAEEFWRSIINFEALADAGTISPEDLDLFKFAETAEEGWNIIADWWKLK
ncbi:MAG: lysine decarboxylase [Methyloligella sp.]|nr:MAG: lysine decarboxylase [Methyloligella sp.]